MKISEHVYLVGSEQFGLSHPLDCNCYLIDGGSALGLVDTGTGMGVESILAHILSHGFELEALTHILITHSHLGHWGGASELRDRTGAQVWVPAGAVPAMTNIEEEPGIRVNFKFGRYPSGFEPRPCPPDATFADGDRVTVGNLELNMILTQGHTKDSTCFLFHTEGKRSLFTGDTLFYGGKIGLVNLGGCSLVDYRRDIGKLADFGIDRLLPGHGVFVLRGGQKHIKRAICKLSDYVLPDSFYEVNEFSWDREYLRIMTE